MIAIMDERLTKDDNPLDLKHDNNYIDRFILSDKQVISVDNGHGTLNKKRKCPKCRKPTILNDGGWEICSECEWCSKEA